MRAPYVKLYRDEPGSFGQLPLMTRALAKQLLILADNDGVIHLGRRAPHEAVCFALGAERTERRSVRAHVDLLLADGYLVLDAERRTLTIPSFPRIGDAPPTPPQRSAVATPTEPERSAVEAPTEPERSANGALTVLQYEPKCAEPHEPLSPIREDKRREEERREEESRSSAPDPTSPRERFDPMAYHASHPVVVAVVETWRAEYARCFGRAYVARGHGDALAAGRLAHWCELHAAASSASAAETAETVVRHFVAAKHGAGGTVPAMTWLDPDGVNYPLDPSAYLEAPKARAPRRGRGSPKPVSPVEEHIPVGPEPPPLPDDIWSGDLPLAARSL